MTSAAPLRPVARLGRLTRRPEFLAVAACRRKWVAPGVIVQMRRRGGDGTEPALPAGAPAAVAVPAATSPTLAAPSAPGPSGLPPCGSLTGGVRLGFTASKKVGGSVVRNRARRRLREAARLVLGGQAAAAPLDLVLIARAETVTRPWPDLVADLELALRKLGVWRTAAGDARGS